MTFSDREWMENKTFSTQESENVFPNEARLIENEGKESRNEMKRYNGESGKLQKWIIKGTVSVNLIDPPCRVKDARFTTEFVKP